MGIALTGGRVLLKQFQGTTAADLGASLITGLQWCGWEVESLTTYGFRLQCESPQGMDVFLYVEDLGHRFSLSFKTTLSLRFETIDGVVTGQNQEIERDAAGGYMLWANQCSLFLAQTGINANSGGGSVCGGIPFVPGAGSCNGQLQALTTTQAFFAMGDYGGGSSPRIQLIRRGSQNNCEACWNTSYCGGGDTFASVRIPALTIASSVGSGFNFPARSIWYTYDDVCYEAFLAWGIGAGAVARLRGQIYDAAVCSLPRVLETKFIAKDEFQEYPMLNWTDNWIYGGLGLLLTTLDPNAGNLLLTGV